MLQKNIIDIDLAKGIETQVDEKVLEGKNLLVENATYNKFKALQKCKGYSEFTHDIVDGGTLSGKIKNVFKVGKQLVCSASDRFFYAYDPMRAKWEKLEGAIFPAKVFTDEVYYSGNTQNKPDTHFNTRKNLIATVFEETDDKSTGIYNVKLSIKNLETDSENVIDVINDDNHLNPRVHILDNNTDIYYRVFYTNNASVYSRIYNENLSLISTSYLGASIDGAVIDIDIDSNDTAITFSRNALDMEVGLLGFNFGSPGSLDYVSAVWTPLTAYHGSYGVAARFINDILVFGIVNSDRDVSVIGYNYAFNSIEMAETELAVDTYDGGAYKVDVSKTSSGIGVFIESTKQYVGSSLSIISTSCIDCSYSVAGAVKVEEYVGDGMRLMSKVYRNPEDGSFYALMGENAPLQTTHFFCKLTFDDYYFDVINTTYKILKNEVIGHTLKGASSGLDVVTQQVGISFDNGVFYSAYERSRRYLSNSDQATDGSGIDIIKIDTNDFSMQYGEFGKSSIVAAGMVLDCDGEEILENGYLVSPERVLVSIDGGSGSISAGVRSYKIVFESYNSKGELTRSAPSPSVSITNTDNNKNFIEWVTPAFGQRQVYRSRATIYRTVASGDVYYKVKSFEFFARVIPYQFISSNDDLSDSVIQQNEILYTNGGELQNDSAPNATSISIANNRAFLAGLDNQNEVGYSKLGVFELSPSFSDFFRLTIDVSKRNEKGRVVAVAHLDDKTILFKESSIFYVLGKGPDNNGLNDDFSQPESISSDVGCVEENSVINVVDGIIFKSKKGFYKLDRGMSLSYIGNAVHDFDEIKVKSSIIVEKENEIRFYLESDYVLVYHYLLGEWDTFTYYADSAVAIEDDVYFAKDGFIYQNNDTFTYDGDFYSLRVRTPWLKISSLKGFQRVYRGIVTGEYKSHHNLVLRVYFDYDLSRYEEHIIEVDSVSTYDFQAHIANQKCSAIMFEIFDNPISGGESMELNTLTVQYGSKRGTAKTPAVKRF